MKLSSYLPPLLGFSEHRIDTCIPPTVDLPHGLDESRHRRFSCLANNVLADTTKPGSHRQI